jgi:dipeptidase
MGDSVVAVGDQTAAGVTLFAKNSDRRADECQPFVQFSEGNHPPEAVLNCTHIAIPQVPETYRVMGHSPWWAWGLEHGVNEFAVAIGCHRIFSNEAIDAKPGLIGMDLVRLGLERGRSAREALEIIAGLIEVHGQGGPSFAPDAEGDHNAFLLADSDESWLLETSNQRWAARRCSLQGVSNTYSIGSDWEFGSRDLAEFARMAGWWSQSGRLDVAAAYCDSSVSLLSSKGRRRRSRELLNEASGHHEVATLQRLLRDHLDGGGSWRCGSTPDEECHYTLCAHSEPLHWTTASIVAPLPSKRQTPWPIWISFGTPCTGIFLPVYLSGVIPAELARGGDEPRSDSAWWTFKRLQDAASRDPARTTPILRAGWAEFEVQLEQARLVAEEAARGAALAGDRDRAAQDVTEFMDWAVSAALDRAELLRDRIE